MGKTLSDNLPSKDGPGTFAHHKATQPTQEAPSSDVVEAVARAVMVWGQPHFKHMVAFSTLCEAIEAALASTAALSSDVVEAAGEHWLHNVYTGKMDANTMRFSAGEMVAAYNQGWIERGCAALASTAGDTLAENERLLKRSRELEEALKDAAYALSWAARKMQGHCRGSDVSATMLAAGNATQARTALGSDQ